MVPILEVAVMWWKGLLNIGQLNCPFKYMFSNWAARNVEFKQSFPKTNVMGNVDVD